MTDLSNQEELARRNKQFIDKYQSEFILLDSHTQTIRLESLKIAVTLLEDYIKENTLSPRDNSMDILWEVADKCADYCMIDKRKK